MHIYAKFQNLSYRNYISGRLGWSEGKEQGGRIPKDHEETFGNDYGVGFMGTYEGKNQKIIPFKSVQFIACQVYPNKTDTSKLFYKD